MCVGYIVSNWLMWLQSLKSSNICSCQVGNPVISAEPESEGLKIKRADDVSSDQKLGTLRTQNSQCPAWIWGRNRQGCSSSSQVGEAWSYTALAGDSRVTEPRAFLLSYIPGSLCFILKQDLAKLPRLELNLWSYHFSLLSLVLQMRVSTPSLLRIF